MERQIAISESLSLGEGSNQTDLCAGISKGKTMFGCRQLKTIVSTIILCVVFASSAAAQYLDREDCSLTFYDEQTAKHTWRAPYFVLIKNLVRIEYFQSVSVGHALNQLAGPR